MAPVRPHLPPLSTPKNMTFPSELRDAPPHTCLDTKDPGPKTSMESESSITPPSAYTEFLNTFSPIFTSPKSSRANFSKYMLDKPRPSPTSAPPSAISFPSSRLPSRSHGDGCGHRRSNSNGSGHISSYGNHKHTSTLPVPSPRCFKTQTPVKSPIKRESQNQHQAAPRNLRLPSAQGQAQLGQGYLYTPVTAYPLSATTCPHQHHHHSYRPSPSEWRFHQLETPVTATEAGSFSLRQVTTTTVTFRVAPRLAAPPIGKRKRVGVGKKSA
ncbi:uncharacterized protein BDV17DRAFT_100504 [Aspergillus undulatus]|uniref:uncharacterized protein n=1 Tax=Aspergillus undulatus TaxID=1810928 RepID=UPI003CCDE8D9